MESRYRKMIIIAVVCLFCNPDSFAGQLIPHLIKSYKVKAGYLICGYGIVQETGRTTDYFPDQPVTVFFYDDSIKLEYPDGSGSMYDCVTTQNGISVYKNSEKPAYYLVDKNYNMIQQTRSTSFFGSLTINYKMTRVTALVTPESEKNAKSEYKFKDISDLPSTPSYGNLHDGRASSGSNEGASTREIEMYKQQYQKWVDVFNSNLKSLHLVEGTSSESTFRQSMRREQNYMRETRMEAQQKGIYIPQAYEETMSF